MWKERKRKTRKGAGRNGRGGRKISTSKRFRSWKEKETKRGRKEEQE